MGYEEYEGEKYTALLCNQFDEIIRTKDGIGSEVGSITTYLDGEHFTGDTIKISSTVPSWVQESAFFN